MILEGKVYGLSNSKMSTILADLGLFVGVFLSYGELVR